jgi:uncharacterized protein YbjT (DUF2867 family)
MQKTAILFGASGLVGHNLLYLLLESAEYNKIIAFSRCDLPLRHPKLENRLFDSKNLDALIGSFTGDDLFCCLGTTIRKAGSQDAFRQVDYTMVVELARIAHQAGVKQVIAISSIGAKASSSNFYLRVKGEMENELQKIPFQRVVLVRPSLLLGHRTDWRMGEEFGKLIFKAIGFFFLGPARKYRAIEGMDVARAMIRLAGMQTTGPVVESDLLMSLAQDLK